MCKKYIKVLNKDSSKILYNFDIGEFGSIRLSCDSINIYTLAQEINDDDEETYHLFVTNFTDKRIVRDIKLYISFYEGKFDFIYLDEKLLILSDKFVIIEFD